MQYKGRGKRYLTEEEIRISEEKKSREKEWKVCLYYLHISVTIGLNLMDLEKERI